MSTDLESARNSEQDRLNKKKILFKNIFRYPFERKKIGILSEFGKILSSPTVYDKFFYLIVRIKLETIC